MGFVSQPHSKVQWSEGLLQDSRAETNDEHAVRRIKACQSPRLLPPDDVAEVELFNRYVEQIGVCRGNPEKAQGEQGDRDVRYGNAFGDDKPALAP